jgi:hypothetical protein
MKIGVEISFTDLWCIIPNESADEPYLWAFFVKLDGDTVRQLPPPNGFALSGSAQVVTATGSHGNLGAKGIIAGRHISIPPQVASYSTRLRAIPFTVPTDDAPHEETVYVPGQVVAVVVLMEEDASPDGGIEAGHQSLRSYIETQINEFIGGLNLVEIYSEGKQRRKDLGGELRDHMAAIVKERFQSLIGDIRDNAESVITLEVLGAHAPGAIWEFLDADDSVGTVTYKYDERELLTSSVAHNLLEDIVSMDDGHVDTLYRLAGSLSVTVTGSSQDVREMGGTIGAPTPVETGTHVYEESTLCVEAGETADWTRLEQREEERFLFLYPFLSPRWVLNGQLLDQPAGEAKFMATCTFPYFDPRHPNGPEYRSEMREVAVSYETFSEGQLMGVRLRNRPDDGSFYATLDVSAAGGTSAAVQIASISFGFDGQAIVSPLYERFEECINRIRGPGGRYARFRRVGPRDLWGPSGRQRWYEEQVEVGRQLVAARLLNTQMLEAAEKVLRDRLRLGREGPG